jgi:hypothetical protein
MTTGTNHFPTPIDLEVRAEDSNKVGDLAELEVDDEVDVVRCTRLAVERACEAAATK